MARAKPFEFDPSGPTRLDGSGVVPVPWVRTDLAPAVRVRECRVGDDASFPAAVVDAAVRNPWTFAIVRRRTQSEQQLASWRHGNAGQWSKELCISKSSCMCDLCILVSKKCLLLTLLKLGPGRRIFAPQAIFFYENVSKQIFCWVLHPTNRCSDSKVQWNDFKFFLSSNFVYCISNYCMSLSITSTETKFVTLKFDLK